MEKKLTNKQAKFVREYLVDLNGAQAAIRTGYSKKTAKEAAYELLTKPHIREAIDKLQKELAEKCDISIERVLLEYKRLATFDIRKAFDENGKLKSIHELDDDTAAAISGIESKDLFEGHGKDREYIGVLHSIKVTDKRAALSDLMRHMGGFEKDNAQKSASDNTVILSALASSKSSEERTAIMRKLLKK